MTDQARSRFALTQFSHGAGCGCKLSSAELNQALSAASIPFPSGPDVLVGPGTSDDAGVFRLTQDLALVQTMDFFTPIVDDAETWGAIAATNALSDVYAMGGRPVTAMNIVAWPRDVLPWKLLGQVLDGASRVLGEAGCAVLGGHSIDDAEPKFGCSITGLVDPALMLTNAAGRPGDVLVLTKRLGIGVITTATKSGDATAGNQAEAIATMLHSNRAAAQAATRAGVRCATDVTGFGLVGHLRELAKASATGARLVLRDVPIIEGARSLLDGGAAAGGTRRNHAEAVGVAWGETSLTDQMLLCDAQTSGGLLLAAAPDAAAAVVAELGLDAAWVIGELVPRSSDPDSPWLTIS